MKPLIRSHFVDFTGLSIMVIALVILSFSTRLQHTLHFSSSLLNLNTIFLSILIEAFPFVLIGVLIAGLIQIFITEDHIRRCIPRNKFMAVVMGCTIGAIFPGCECGIVPIVRRLVGKGVPIYAGIGFLLTGPLINPIVIASTYMAFGNDMKIAALRMVIGFIAALIIACFVSLMFKGNQFKASISLGAAHSHSHSHNESFMEKFWSMLIHSIDEFFDMGKYLIIGAFFAAFVQTYVSTGTLLNMGAGIGASTLVMMGLAYVLSLCSEADAFIAASFSSIFPTTPILGFLIFGPMIDLKNTIMMMSVFRFKFVMAVLFLVISIVFITLMLAQRFI